MQTAPYGNIQDVSCNAVMDGRAGPAGAAAASPPRPVQGRGREMYILRPDT